MVSLKLIAFISGIERGTLCLSLRQRHTNTCAHSQRVSLESQLEFFINVYCQVHGNYWATLHKSCDYLPANWGRALITGIKGMHLPDW